MIRTLRLAVAGLLLLLALAASAAAYPWPFKPFDRQHPIRAFFGDPRTVYEDGILAGAFDGPGLFSFHQGIDISAPNGAPIYAVADGTAHYMGAATLNVTLFGLVICGETGPCATCNEKFWLLFGLIPLSAVMSRS